MKLAFCIVNFVFCLSLIQWVSGIYMDFGLGKKFHNEMKWYLPQLLGFKYILNKTYDEQCLKTLSLS